MKRLLLIAVVSALAVAKPDIYREKEDFQYSRSSTDEGSKSGYYGAQRGNMGGNYERAHNMDGLAQNQMSGLVKTVEGELGEGSKTRTGSVFTAANSKGIYGSGNYDLSNLEGRNFQEGSTFDDSLSSSSSSGYNAQSSSSSTNGAYSNSNSHSSGYHSGYNGHSGQSSRYLSNNYDGFGRYQGQGYKGQVGDLQELDSTHGVRQYDYGGQATSGHYSKSAYHGQNAYDHSRTNSQTSSDYAQSNSNSESRLITAMPVKVVIRPGTRVPVPIAAQTINTISTDSAYDQNSVNSEAEIVNNPAYGPTGQPKHYESAYSYHKEWEKHGTKPVVGTTESPFPKNSELYEDTQAHISGQQYDSSALDSQSSRLSNSNSGYDTNVKSTSSSNRYRHTSNSNDEYNKAASTSSSNANTYAGYNSGTNSDVSNQFEVTNNKPKSYHSAYSYHKSWERQGDPYVIKPAGGVNSAQEYQKLTADSGNQGTWSSHQYGSNSQKNSQHYLNADDCDCEEDSHRRFARSYNTNQQAQNKWENIEDLGQQTQTQNQWDKQQTGQQTQNQWGNLDTLGQQTQNQWDKLENLDQQTYNQRNTFSEQSRPEAEVAQQIQNFWLVQDPKLQNNYWDIRSPSNRETYIDHILRHHNKESDKQNNLDVPFLIGVNNNKPNEQASTQYNWDKTHFYEAVLPQSSNSNKFFSPPSTKFNEASQMNNPLFSLNFGTLGNEHHHPYVNHLYHTYGNNWKSYGQFHTHNSWQEQDNLKHTETDYNNQNTQSIPPLSGLWNKIDTIEKQSPNNNEDDKDISHTQTQHIETNQQPKEFLSNKTSGSSFDLNLNTPADVSNRPNSNNDKVLITDTGRGDIGPEEQDETITVTEKLYDGFDDEHKFKKFDSELKSNKTPAEIESLRQTLDTNITPIQRPTDKSVTIIREQKPIDTNVQQTTSRPQISTSYDEIITITGHSKIAENINEQSYNTSKSQILLDSKIEESVETEIEKSSKELETKQSTKYDLEHFEDKQNTDQELQITGQQSNLEQTNTEIFLEKFDQQSSNLEQQFENIDQQNTNTDEQNTEQKFENFDQQSSNLEQQNTGQQFENIDQQNTNMEQQNTELQFQNFGQQGSNLEQQNTEQKFENFDQQSSNLKQNTGQQFENIDQQNTNMEQQNTEQQFENFGQQGSNLEQQNTEQKYENFDQQNTGQQFENIDQQNTNTEQQNTEQFENFGEQGSNLEQQNTEQKFENFDQQSSNLDQQNTGQQFENIDQQNTNTEQQNTEQQFENFGQQGSNLEQQNTEQKFENFDQQSSNLEENTGQQFESFGQQNLNAEQQNTEQKFENFGQQSSNLEQQNTEQQFESYSQQSSNLEQQNTEQQFENFGQESSNLEQQNTEQKFESFGEQSSNLEQQNTEQQFDNFGQQSLNLEQQNTEQQFESFGQQNLNSEQQNTEQKFENFGQQSSNLEQQFENVDQQSSNLETKNTDQQLENLWKLEGLNQQNTFKENFGLQSNSQQKEDTEQQIENNQQPTQINKQVDILEVIPGSGDQKHTTYSPKHKDSQNNGPKSSENINPSRNSTEQPLEATAEKPGFWKNVGNKLSSAKDTVFSWFREG